MRDQASKPSEVHVVHKHLSDMRKVSIRRQDGQTILHRTGCNSEIIGGECGIRGRVDKYSHYFHISGSIIRCFASASSNAPAISAEP